MEHSAEGLTTAFSAAARSVQQKALLADTARVSTLCPSEYPEMLRLSVELMTSFSRLAAPPGSEGTSIENIADGQDDMRQRSFSASI